MKFFRIFFLLLFFSSSCLFGKIYPHSTPVIEHLKKIKLTEPKSGIEPIDCIYIINLDERPEKWKKMKSLLKNNGLRGNRVSGINGWNISTEIQSQLAGNYPMRLRGGQIGCLLSHVSVLKNAKEQNFDVIWVCEDDIEFIDDIRKIPEILARLNQIDPDWDVFYTDIDFRKDPCTYIPSLSSDFRPDGINPPLSELIQRTVVDPDIMKIGQRFGTHSLIISKKGIKKILHYFTHVYLWTAIDIDMHYIPGIRQYSSTRDIVSNNPFEVISDTVNIPLKVK